MRRGTVSILLTSLLLIAGCTHPPEDTSVPEVLIPDPDLRDVFEGMEEDDGSDYSPEEWVIHDPSSIQEIDGYLMIGVTGKEPRDDYPCGLETWNIPPGKSEFEPWQCLLSDKPDWIEEEVPTNDGAYWAPGMLDARTMYYTVPPGDAMEDGEETRSCIGLLKAKGEMPNLTWYDHGAPITCSELGEANEDEPEPGTIDAAVFSDGNDDWIIYGGGHIWMAPLDSVNGQITDEEHWSNDGNHVHLANGPNVDEDGAETDEEQWIEAAFMHKEGDYYYLFVNWYHCCNGADSTYEIRVGRSEKIEGPYLDDEGVSMLDGGGKLFLDDSMGYNGPGHPGIYSYQDEGDTKQAFSFHHYPEDGKPWAYLEVRMLEWDENDWPELDPNQDFSP